MVALQGQAITVEASGKHAEVNALRQELDKAVASMRIEVQHGLATPVKIMSSSEAHAEAAARSAAVAPKAIQTAEASVAVAAEAQAAANDPPSPGATRAPRHRLCSTVLFVQPRLAPPHLVQ